MKLFKWLIRLLKPKEDKCPYHVEQKATRIVNKPYRPKIRIVNKGK